MLSRFGKIEIAKSHHFSDAVNGFQISPYMQEKMVYAGQSDCYAESQQIVSKYLLVGVSLTQMQRVTNRYGSLLEAERQKEKLTRDRPQLTPEEIVYVQADGGMIFTREEGWKEVKVGRIFKESDCLEVGGERGWIKHSEYDAYLGDCKRFTGRFEQKLEPYAHLGKRLVFVTDGAIWIKHWKEDAFPDALHSLDWYHAMQHLGSFAELYFKEPHVKERWIAKQESLLYNSKVNKVIDNIKKLLQSCADPATINNGKQLMDYYDSNKNRMDYKYYRTIGAGIIGSGAIEAAQRTVVQKRLKMSGQRWSKQGAQNVLALRCANLSEQWNKVIELITTNAMAA